MLGNIDKSSAGPGTVIGANVKLVGALKDANDITLHGLVEGEVSSEKTLTIGETAEITGPVSGATVSVAGLIKGSIDASIRLELLPTGRVIGDITAKDLVIRSGAVFVGKCAMTDEKKTAAANSLPEHESSIHHPKESENES